MRPIIDAVLKRYGLTRELLVTTTAVRDVRASVEARSMCCWLARQIKLPITDQEIAAILGSSARSTVVQGVRRINALRDRDRVIREQTDALVVELGA